MINIPAPAIRGSSMGNFEYTDNNNMVLDQQY